MFTVEPAKNCLIHNKTIVFVNDAALDATAEVFTRDRNWWQSATSLQKISCSERDTVVFKGGHIEKDLLTLIGVPFLSFLFYVKCNFISLACIFA